MNIDHKMLKESFNLDVIQAEKNATHVVIGIDYGAIAAASISVGYNRDEDISRKSSQLQVRILRQNERDFGSKYKFFFGQ